MVSQGSHHSPQVNGRGNVVAGGDVNTKRGGAVLVAIVALVAIIWGGSKAYTAITNTVSGPHLNSNSTCRQWLEADEATQRQSALAVAEAEGNKNEMSDGFIVQNVQYNCGNNPDATLGDILAVRSAQ